MQILFITHRVPYPPDKGDRIRTFHVLQCLARCGSVDLVSLADEPTAPSVHDVLARWTRRVAFVPHQGGSRLVRAAAFAVAGKTLSEGAFYNPRLSRLVANWSRQEGYDVVVASASSLAPYVFVPELRRARALFDMMDVDSQKWLDYARASLVPRSWLYRFEAHRLRRLEREILKRSRGVILVSASEASLFENVAGPGPIHAIPNGVDLEYFSPAAEPIQSDCVFVGALDYKPNIEASIWFCTRVWPELRARNPERRVRLVGRRPSPSVQKLGTMAGVEVVGQVPDVRGYVASSSVVIAPLQIARGIQNKVLEALAMAKPVVASGGALEGLALEPGRDAIRADTVSEWTSAIESLWNDPGQRERLGSAGRAFVEKHHSWERCLEPLEQLVGSFEPRPECVGNRFG